MDEEVDVAQTTRQHGRGSGYGQLSRRQALRLAGAGGAGLALGLGLGQGAGRGRRAGAQGAARVGYWHHFTSETEMAGLERVLASFTEEHPDIEVVPENIPNADFMAKFTSAALADGLPDASMVTADRVRDMVAMDALTPVTARLENWPERAGFAESAWQGATVDEEIYGVPAFMFVNWMYYRRDWFEEAGIAGPPQTWEEFGEVARQLTDPAQGRFGFGLRGGDGGEGWVIDLFEAWGSPIVDEQGCAALDTAKATEALAFYAGLLTEAQAAPPSAPGDSYRQVMEAFRTGQTGMVLHHTGSLKEVTDALGDNVMTAPIPAGPGSRVARVSPLYNGLARPADEEAAWTWLAHWGKVDTEIAFLEETGYFPPNIAATEDPRITENPIYTAASETLAFGSLPPAFAGYPGWAKQTVLPAFQQVLTGALTPEAAVELMATGLADETGC